MWINTQLVVIKRCEKAKKKETKKFKKNFTPENKWNHLLFPFDEISIIRMEVEGENGFIRGRDVLKKIWLCFVLNNLSFILNI